MSDLITQAELARRIGVSRAYITKLKNNGVIIEKFGKVDYEASVKSIEDYSSPSRATTPTITFKLAQTAKEAARAKLVQMQVKQKEGELINAEDMVNSLQDLFLSIKSDLRSIPSGLDVKPAIRKVVATGIDRALERLSKWNPPE